MAEPSAISEVRARHRAERAAAASDPVRRAAILEAAERVLERTPVHELSVAQIIGEAGVARATFYAYFESKYEVIAALMDSVMVQMYDLLLPFAERAPDVPPRAALTEVLTESARLWHRHAVVFRATHDHRHAVPELAEQWLRVTEQFTDAVAAGIDRDVAAGLAPGGRNTRQLAASLVWSSEHLFYVAGSNLDDDLPSEEAIVATLVNLWLAAIYGTLDS
jgi:TetR/AcrR family transcriptional regulator, ethionamide resistance regulator